MKAEVVLGGGHFGVLDPDFIACIIIFSSSVCSGW